MHLIINLNPVNYCDLYIVESDDIIMNYSIPANEVENTIDSIFINYNIELVQIMQIYNAFTAKVGDYIKINYPDVEVLYSE